MKGAHALSLLLWSAGVTAAPRPSYSKRSVNHNIGFDCGFPHHNSNLPLFSLGHHATFPDDQLEDILKSAAPGAKLNETKVDGSRYFYDGDRLVGYFDSTNGQTSVFPTLSSLKPATDIDTRGISHYLNNDAIIPDDDTRHSIVIGSRFSGSQKTIDGQASPPATYLLESIIQREVSYENQLYPVCGPGTKASFSFGSDGSVQALSHQWRTARSQDSKITPLSQDAIQQTIADQLSAANLVTNVTVQSVDLCFYDSGNNFIQPVYRYNATISNPFGLAEDLIIGFVPAGGNAQEALPTLTAPANQVVPTFTGNSNSTNGTIPRSLMSKRQDGGIKVGRYVMSNDQYSPNMVTDENGFWNGLSSVSSSFVNSQYYWDEPFIYGSDAQDFVDSVNIAFTEGHGNVHYFTTNELEPNWGGVTISSDLPSNGYGPGAGGSLAYWSIRSCDVVSTPIDYDAADFDKAFDPWWSVFNGMHAVMGYRTNAAVGNGDDGIGNIGKALGMGASAVHGWMSGALSSGKTSAVTVCGHDDDTVFQIEDIGKPSCLQIWWYS